MKKPREVVYAVRLLVSALGLGLLSLAIAGIPAAPGATAALLSESNKLLIQVLSVVLSSVIVGLLCFMISIGKNWARITFAVLLGIGVPCMIPELPHFTENRVRGIILALQTGMQVYATVLLFSKPAAPWFGKHDQVPAADESGAPPAPPPAT